MVKNAEPINSKRAVDVSEGRGSRGESRRMAVESKLVIEGASGCGVAAARKYGPQHRWKKAVCVVTGGNIDPGVFTEIIHGGVPTSTTSKSKM